MEAKRGQELDRGLGVESVPNRENRRQRSGGEDALRAKLQGLERTQNVWYLQQFSSAGKGVWGRAGAWV